MTSTIRLVSSALAGVALVASWPALAQPAGTAEGEADPTLYPPVVAVTKIDGGFRYTSPRGQTLYMLNPREARTRKGSVLEYCVAQCATMFTPLAAAEAAQPVGLWKPETTSRGMVWTYKGSPVFSFNADGRLGEAGGDGFEDIFGTIEYVPARPSFDAPPPAALRYRKGQWVLTDDQGRFLYTGGGGEPLVTGLAARPRGDWSIVAAGDRMQWAYKRRPVFVAAQVDVPPEGEGITPLTVAALHADAK